jgi:aspartyl protease family protein
MDRFRWFVAALLVCVALDASAASINVVGLSKNKAFVAVDGEAPKGVAVGETIAGFKLLSVDGDAATFLVDGHRETIAMGSYLARPNRQDRPRAVLGWDSRGHYVAQGQINGSPTRFLVDTGATVVVLSMAEADRLGIRYGNAPQATAATANGTVPYRVVKLDRVKVGDVEVTNVDAGVIEGSYDGPNLLGMSFLSRMEVTRDGASMVLIRRF